MGIRFIRPQGPYEHDINHVKIIVKYFRKIFDNFSQNILCKYFDFLPYMEDKNFKIFLTSSLFSYASISVHGKQASKQASKQANKQAKKQKYFDIMP